MIEVLAQTPRHHGKEKPTTQIRQFLLRYVSLFCTGMAIFVVFASIVSSQANLNCEAPSSRPILDQSIHSEHLWTICTGISTGTRGMLIYNENLIVGDYTRDAMLSFDIPSGSVQWTSTMRGMGSLILDSSRERIYTYTIYSGLREIYAVDPNTGDVIWYNGDQNGKRDGYDPILLADGQLIAYASLSETVRKLDAESGELGETISVASLRIYPNGYAWHMVDGYLVATDAMTGEVFWQATETIPGHCCLWDVQMNDEIVLAKLGTDLAAYNFETGQLLWNTTDLNMVSYATLTPDAIYALDLGARLLVIDPLTGTERGYIQFEPAAPGHNTDLLDSESISSSLIIANDNILAIFWGDIDMLSVYRIDQ